MFNGNKSKRGSQYVLAFAVIATLSGGAVSAAVTGTWSGNTSADWFTAGNWNALPGSVTLTTNTDTAIFNTNPANGNGTTNPVIVDANLDVGKILFDTNAGSFVIGSAGQTLELTQSVSSGSGGQITQILPTLTAPNITETINAAILIEQTSSGPYNFDNFAPDPTTTFVIGSTISGGNATGTGVVLGGTNTGNNMVVGDIGPGAAATFSFTKAGSGTWTVKGNISVAGAVNAGTVTLVGGTLNASSSATSTTAAPIYLGTDNFILSSTLALNNVTSGDVAYSSTSASTSAILYISSLSGYEDVIAFNAVPGSGGNVTYTIGNSSATNATNAIKRNSSNGGTSYPSTYMVIAPSALSNLGSSEKLFITGVSATTNNILAPFIFVEDPLNHQGADYVTYSATNGVVLASDLNGVYVDQSATDINSAAAASIFNVDRAGAALSASKALSALRTAYSIDLAGNTLTISGANYRQMTSSGSNQAGLILNGNGTTIGTALNPGTLNFGVSGAAEAIIYTAQNATINSAVNSKGLTVAGPGTLTLNGPLNLGGTTLRFNNPGDTVINGAITDTASITYAGFGTVTLNANNTAFSGGLTIGTNYQTGSGTLVLGNNGAAGTGTLTLYSAASTAGPVLYLQANTALTNITNAVTIGETSGGNYVGAFNGSNDMTFTGTITTPATAIVILNDMTAGATLSFSGGTYIRLTTGSTTFAGSGNTVFGDAIPGSGTVTMNGTGTLTLSNPNNTYTGATSITSGTVIVSGAGTINTTSSITVNGSGATFLTNSSVPETAPITITKGTIGGSGAINATGGVAIGTNATISPGNSPAAQTYSSSLKFQNGGTYKWELNQADGTTAGTNYDQIDATGGLTITATGGTFKLDITSLKTDNTPGDVADFDNTHNYAWLIASTSALTGYDPADFNLSTANFTNDLGIGAFALHLGSDIGTGFALDGNNTDLYLTFTGGTPVPEPKSLALLALGAAGLLMRRRRAAD